MGLIHQRVTGDHHLVGALEFFMSLWKRPQAMIGTQNQPEMVYDGLMLASLLTIDAHQCPFMMVYVIVNHHKCPSLLHHKWQHVHRCPLLSWLQHENYSRFCCQGAGEAKEILSASTARHIPWGTYHGSIAPCQFWSLVWAPFQDADKLFIYYP